MGLSCIIRVMKRKQLGRLQQIFKAQLDSWSSHRMLTDRLSWAIILPTIVLNALTVLLLVLKLHPTDSLVPVHYSNLTGSFDHLGPIYQAGGFDRLGPWYQSFSIGIFAGGVTILNTILAMLTFGRSRITSFFLMVGAFVVGLFALVISMALTTGV